MKCLNCNHNLPDDSEFCQYCGNKIEVNAEEETVNESIDNAEEKKLDVSVSPKADEVLVDVDVDNMTPTKPIKLKKEKKVKTKYCSRCGSVIDSQTKICTGCGRKYFKIRLNKFTVTILIMSVVSVALFALNIFQYLNTQILREEISDLEAKLITWDNLLEHSIDKNVELEKENAELIKENREQRKELRFFDNYAVVVSDDGTRKYHKYGCSDLDTASFWIYNTEAAEDYGYYACPKCCD